MAEARFQMAGTLRPRPVTGTCWPLPGSISRKSRMPCSSGSTPVATVVQISGDRIGTMVSIWPTRRRSSTAPGWASDPPPRAAGCSPSRDRPTRAPAPCAARDRVFRPSRPADRHESPRNRARCRTSSAASGVRRVAATQARIWASGSPGHPPVPGDSRQARDTPASWRCTGSTTASRRPSLGVAAGASRRSPAGGRTETVTSTAAPSLVVPLTPMLSGRAARRLPDQRGIIAMPGPATRRFPDWPTTATLRHRTAPRPWSPIEGLRAGRRRWHPG